MNGADENLSRDRKETIQITKYLEMEIIGENRYNLYYIENGHAQKALEIDMDRVAVDRVQENQFTDGDIEHFLERTAEMLGELNEDDEPYRLLEEEGYA